uniref:Uncharacterized protein n=1 Tax=Schistosoma japonicum TaxID=6182 RepID=Q5BW40_SCHJA|nr:unknown [Schistosoma japonicum]
MIRKKQWLIIMNIWVAVILRYLTHVLKSLIMPWDPGHLAHQIEGSMW